jgi:hypothetical protein
MADAVKKLSVRLAVEGASEAQTRLQAFAKAGTESMGAAGQAARNFSTGLESTGKAANENASRVTRLGEAFDTAEGKIKGTVRGINDVRGAIELVAPGASAATEGIANLAGTIGNLSDVAGTLATVFLRNPLGLVALGLSAAVVGYLALAEKIDKTVVAEEAYQKAVASTGPLIETQIVQTKRLAEERFAAAKIDVESGIAAQEAAARGAEAARTRLQGTLDRLRAAQARNPERDFSVEINQTEASIAALGASIDTTGGRIEELRRRLVLAAPEAQDLGRALEAVRAELEGFGVAKPTVFEALNADFERVKTTLDSGLAEGLRLTRAEYDAQLATAAKRRDLGIAAALEDEAIRVQAASAALYASLQDVIDREQLATNERQRSGGDINARIDAYHREADATLLGADALAAFRREQEEGRIAAQAYSDALKAYPDDLEAVQGAVDQTVDAWRRLKDAQALVPTAKSDTDKLRESVDGLARGWENAGRRAARTFADMIVGADKTRVSVQALIQAIAADVAEAQIRSNITGPLTDGIGSFIGSLPSLLGVGSTPVGNFGATFGGPRAMGGPVEPGVAYIVGEKRPELFVPDTAGRIVPEIRRAPAADFSGASEGASGARGNVIVNVYDNRSSRESSPVAVSERRGRDGNSQIDILIEDKVEAALAGGRFDSSMQSRYGARKTVRRT